MDNRTIRIFQRIPEIRVWTTRMLDRVLAYDGAASATVTRRIRDLSEAGLIQRVRNGVFINKLASPPVTLAESAGFIRTGAIVSLQTVLGDCGALNNYTQDATIILPSASNVATGTIRTDIGDIIIRKLDPKILYAGDVDDRLAQNVGYLRATPEKALIDWIALASSGKSGLKILPAHDIDLDDMDMDRLDRLASSAGLSRELVDVIERIHQTSDYTSILTGF